MQMNMLKSRFLKPFNFIITLKVESLLKELNPNLKREILPMCNNNVLHPKPQTQPPNSNHKYKIKKQAKKLHKCKLHNTYKNLEV